MPRVSICTNLADEQRPGWSAENTNEDYCFFCFDDLTAENFMAHYGVSEDAVEMYADHPQYAGEDYTCECCGCRLTQEDD
jgi:hypothetical protein